ncbi:MAG: UvrD-helicase domain-containing protein [Pirellulales bacterium]
MTDQQHAAIATRDVSIALSAGAGCGKTFVLTERFLSHLDPRGSFGEQSGPAELADLVAFTYTERAAREMRDRIRRKCAERLKAANERDAPHWLALLRQLDTARVSTIHSFCGSFLRSHAVEAGLDPQFRVLDEPQSQTRLWELLDDALRRRLESRDAATMELAGAYGLAPLRERVLLMLRHRDHGAFEAFAGMTPEKLFAHWQSMADERAERVLAEFLASTVFSAAKTFFDAHEFDHEKIGPRAATLRQFIGELSESDRPAELLANVRDAAKLTGLSKKMFESIGADYDDYKSRVQSLREAIDGVKHVALDADACLAAARYGLEMLAIAREVAEDYRKAKRTDHVLDFNDLLLETRRMLTATENASLRRGIARQIRLLLVDESQDTDPVQTDLIDALCDGDTNSGKLFVVGDFKQSIYRFLGAEPRIFRERRGGMPARGRLPLSVNFRSQPAILEFVNLLFGGAFGDEYEPLVAHREQMTPPPAIEFLWASEANVAANTTADATDGAAEDSPAKKTAERGDADRLRKLEADWIARRLSGMIRSGEPLIADESPRDESGSGCLLRAVRPGDVAILFRSLSNVEFYEEALRRYDLPYYLVGGRAFYAQQEVFDLANLLRTLVSPSDDVSLAGALRSPLFNLSDEALFWLARHPNGLRAGLFADSHPGDMDAEQRRRARRAADVLAELRAAKDRVSVAALLNRAIALTGYDAALLGEFLGERKLANLRKLVNLARSFDASGTMSLADFVVQLNEFEADQPKEALAATQSEAGDVVRLMTIHQSKGLEFPVVVVADCESRLRGDGDAARFDARWGPLVGLPARDDDDKATTALRMVRTESSADDEQEAIRLFYVAATRAADYLILSGGVKDVAEPKGFWTRFLAERFDRQSGAFVGPAASGAMRDARAPRIAVTTSPPDARAEPTGHARGPNLARIADQVEQAAQTASAATSATAVARASLPIAADAAARRFYSFSSLSGSLVHETPIVDEDDLPAISTAAEREAEPPETDGDDLKHSARVAALDLGTLVHAVVADLRWDGTDDVAALARRQMARQLREDEAFERQAVELVERLLSMPASGEIAAGRRRLAEVEFLLAWPPDADGAGRAIDADSADGAAPILHGFIDMLFQDADGDWHVIDYKTNRVARDEVPATAAAYEMQLILYALAAERTLGVQPKSLRLCFLVPGVEHFFDWNDNAREKALGTIAASLSNAKSH